MKNLKTLALYLENQDDRIELRVSKELKKALKQKAGKKRLSTYIRDLLFSHLTGP